MLLARKTGGGKVEKKEQKELDSNDLDNYC